MIKDSYKPFSLFFHFFSYFLMYINFCIRMIRYNVVEVLKEVSDMNKAVFQLEPLTCPSCVKKIETALQKQPGVQLAKVLFNAGKIKLEFDAATVPVENLQAVVESLGYPVVKVKVS